MKECNEPFCKDHNQKMSTDNTKRIQDAVKEAGLHLEGKLPEHPGLAKRNSYAHLWKAIKDKMGKSYKDCTDAQVDEILSLIAWHRENPT